jgi:hypothetical protein
VGRQSIGAVLVLFSMPVLGQPCEPHLEALPGVGSAVAALTVFDEGTGGALFAGGGIRVNPYDMWRGGIARWDGTSWSEVGGGLLQAGSSTVRALTVFDDGSGTALYAGGTLTQAGGVNANHIARWDGHSWSALGEGVDDMVRAIASFDEDGPGPGRAVLFAAGTFLSAGGTPARHIARWDGHSWSAVGGGVDDDGAIIRALIVFEGTGPGLYATGTFASIGGTSVSNIARWDGESWSTLGAGIAGGVGAPGIALSVWDDGRGNALYVGGELTMAGGAPAKLCARWDGHSWTALGEGVGGTRIRAMAGYDDGTGSALYCAGELADGLWRWDGKAWGLVGDGQSFGTILSLHPDVQPRQGVYIGRQFSAANITLWAGCPAEGCEADCDGSGDVDLFDFLCFVNLFNAGDSVADCDGSGMLDLFDFLCFVNAFEAGC